MPIQWNEDLALGIPDLDAQHLELDEQLALVHDAICEGRVPDLPAVLDGVRRCCDRHFEREEAYMACSGYPALEDHRERHREFVEQLARLDEARARDGATMQLAIAVGNWLAAWVREHQRYDLSLAGWVRKGGGAGPPEEDAP